MYEAIYRFLLLLRIKVKLLSDDEFSNLLSICDFQQTLYAMYFRYC